jgi:hypothetical protein
LLQTEGKNSCFSITQLPLLLSFGFDFLKTFLLKGWQSHTLRNTHQNNINQKYQLMRAWETAFYLESNRKQQVAISTLTEFSHFPRICWKIHVLLKR